MDSAVDNQTKTQCRASAVDLSVKQIKTDESDGGFWSNVSTERNQIYIYKYKWFLESIVAVVKANSQVINMASSGGSRNGRHAANI